MADRMRVRAFRDYIPDGDGLKQRSIDFMLSCDPAGDNYIFFPLAKISVTLNKLRVITSRSTGCLRQRIERAINIIQTNEKFSFFFPSFYLTPSREPHALFLFILFFTSPALLSLLFVSVFLYWMLNAVILSQAEKWEEAAMHLFGCCYY